MKTVRPVLLPDGAVVHYLWPLANSLATGAHDHAELLIDTTRDVPALGWGVDLVVGHGAIISDAQADALPGERWLPGTAVVDDGLRVPVAGTLDALVARYRQFLARIGPDGVLTAPAPLSVFRQVEYRRTTDSQQRPMAAFSLLDPEGRGFRAFDSARRALTVAGMTRHATKRAAAQAGWADDRINAFILGHAESQDGAQHVAVGPRRFAYMPLPSIETRGSGRSRVAGSIRRVMLYCFSGGCEPELDWARRSLSGQELIGKERAEPVALLSALNRGDAVVRAYTRASSTWATVTPVVLNGYDDRAGYRQRLSAGISAEEQRRLLDRLDRRVESLLRKAITQAGFSNDLAAQAELEWRKVGFWPGVETADRYGVPDHLEHRPRYHVKLRWLGPSQQPVEIAGPVCVGAGRFYGLGLFAALDE